MMLANRLSSRVIQVSLALCVLIVGGSLLHFWHVKRTTDAEYPRHRPGAVDVNDRRPAQDTGGTSPVDFGDAETPRLDAEDASSVSDDTDAARTSETDAEMRDSTETRETDTGAADEPAEEVAVSPFGFGPYPEVPEGYPWLPAWQWSEEKRQSSISPLRDQELIDRVLIKLWNQGDREWVGAKLDDQNGRVFPLYHNVIYVSRWIELPVKGGKTMSFPAGGSSGGKDWDPESGFIEFLESGGKLPDHIQFIDADTAGYDPYVFLNLK